MSIFTYAPLCSTPSTPQIRLLNLAPGPGPITCHLRHAPLSQNQNYEALSYCWGRPSAQHHTIYINSKPFTITPNLHSALKRLRPRTLWVDAICINQSDDQEKNQQVPLMRKIYESAKRVQIWLGEEDKYTTLAYSFLELLAPWGQERLAAGIEARNWMELDGRLKTQNVSHAEERRAWRALYALFERPWFQRIWVIQELAVCPQATMLCGRHSIAWEKVEMANHMSDRILAEGLSRLITERNDWQQGDREDLVHLLVKHLGAQATNPKDKLYALAGIAESLSEYGLEIDYAIGVEKVFEGVTRSYLGKKGDLDILCFTRGYKYASDTTQSWVLDWEYDSENEPRSVYSFAWGPSLMEDGRRFNATKDSVSEISFGEDEKLLGISGSIIDTVFHVGLMVTNNQNSLPRPSWTYWSGLVEDFMCFSNWRDICLIDDVYQSTGQTTLEVFWQTCCVLAPNFDKDVNQICNEFNQFDAFMETFRRLGTLENQHSRPLYHILLLAKLFKQAIMKDPSLLDFSGRVDASTNRCLIRTQNGYIGLAPRLVCQGDSIALIKGGKSPFILRSSGGRWKLVGECYIHGIMHGEAFNEEVCRVLWVG